MQNIVTVQHRQVQTQFNLRKFRKSASSSVISDSCAPGFQAVIFKGEFYKLSSFNNCLTEIKLKMMVKNELPPANLR